MIPCGLYFKGFTLQPELTQICVGLQTLTAVSRLFFLFTSQMTNQICLF